MSELKLNYDNAMQKASRIENLTNEVRTILYSLAEEVSSNVNNVNVWSGNSASRFKDAWERRVDDFENYVNFIHTIHNKIEETSAVVNSTDNK